MATTTSTDLAGQIEKRVSERVNTTLQQMAISLGAIDDRSGEVGPEMDRLDIALLNELAIQDVLENGAVTPQTINPSEFQLALDRQKSVPFAITDKASEQSKIAMVARVVSNGAISMAAEIDDHVFSLINAGAATRVAKTVNPLEDISNAKKLLDDANVPKTDRFLVASPAFVKSLLDQNTIVNANQYGSMEARQAGYVDRIFGFTILESSSGSILEDGFQAFHRESVAFARQMNISLKSEYDVYRHEWQYSLSHLYGAVFTQPSMAVVYDNDGV
jgi:hypothetical protein